MADKQMDAYIKQRADLIEALRPIMEGHEPKFDDSVLNSDDRQAVVIAAYLPMISAFTDVLAKAVLKMDAMALGAIPDATDEGSVEAYLMQRTEVTAEAFSNALKTFLLETFDMQLKSGNLAMRGDHSLH